MDRRLVLVIFDVADDKRRARLTQLLLGYGVRVQYSAFECRVGVSRVQAFCAKIATVIDRSCDRVALYPLCAPCHGDKQLLGEPLGVIPDGDWFIV